MIDTLVENNEGPALNSEIYYSSPFSGIHNCVIQNNVSPPSAHVALYIYFTPFIITGQMS